MIIPEINFIFVILVLVMSVVIHEVSHGYIAYLLGDPTAKMAGRLTLNPVKHIDMFGSIIVPLMLALIPGGLIFGWAKPVPYNPYNLKAGKHGPAYVALAGPLSNIFLALVFGLLIRLGAPTGLLGPEALGLVSLIVMINIILAIFNLIPVPPLDGSTILFSFLPYQFEKLQTLFVRYQLVFILLIIFMAGMFIDPISSFIFRLLTGIS